LAVRLRVEATVAWVLATSAKRTRPLYRASARDLRPGAHPAGVAPVGARLPAGPGANRSKKAAAPAAPGRSRTARGSQFGSGDPPRSNLGPVAFRSISHSPVGVAPGGRVRVWRLPHLPSCPGWPPAPGAPLTTGCPVAAVAPSSEPSGVAPRLSELPAPFPAAEAPVPGAGTRPGPRCRSSPSPAGLRVLPKKSPERWIRFLTAVPPPPSDRVSPPAGFRPPCGWRTPSRSCFPRSRGIFQLTGFSTEVLGSPQGGARRPRLVHRLSTGLSPPSAAGVPHFVTHRLPAGRPPRDSPGILSEGTRRGDPAAAQRRGGSLSSGVG
jgi:hypothetical protein